MDFVRVAPDVRLGNDVKLHAFVNLYGCTIGDSTSIGTFVEIQKKSHIGSQCKISSHTFICEGVTIGDQVFLGHNVTFINDLYPKAVTGQDEMQTDSDWTVLPTDVGQGASIGSSVTILCGVKIGAGAIIGAGSLVLKDIPENEVWAGHPAQYIRTVTT